jgi:hypothetical protein
MISNTRSGERNLAPDAAGRGRINQRPGRAPVLFLTVALTPQRQARHGEGAALCPQRSPTHFLSIEHRLGLYPTRRSPAGPKPDQPMVTSGYGAARIHGPRMIGNGENLFHSANLAVFAGFSTGSDRAVPQRGKAAAILNATLPREGTSP